MAHYPLISTGLGKLTPSMWRRFMHALRWVEQNESRVVMKSAHRRELPKKGGAGKAFWTAAITEIEDLGNNQWAYAWQEEKIMSGFDWFSPESLRRSDPGDFDTWARNLAETENDGEGIEGYGVDVSPGRDADFAYNIVMQPIRVGSRVQMWAETDPDGNDTYWFEAANAINVTAKCAVAPGTGTEPAPGAFDP